MDPVGFIRPLGVSHCLQAALGFVATADLEKAVYHMSAVVRADLTVRDADGQEATAGALAWANPYDHPPAIKVTSDADDGKVMQGQEVHFTIEASDPDLLQPWDAYLAWRADLDGDGNWESDWQPMDKGVTVVKAVFDRPGTRELAFEVRDRFRASGRAMVNLEVQAPPAPVLQAVDPPSSAPGVEEYVFLVGTGLDYPISSVSFGPDVAVLAVEDVTPLSARVRIRVAKEAAQGLRDVLLTFADGREASLPKGFAIGPCAIAVAPANFMVAPSSTLLPLRLSGGATPQLEVSWPTASGGTLIEVGNVYATGQNSGQDILWARSHTCCDANGQLYEDCRATRVVIDVVAPLDSRPVLRGFGGGKGLVVSPGGSAEFPLEVSGLRPPISGVWTLVDVIGGPVWASLRSPSGTEVVLGQPQDGWTSIDYQPLGSMDAFNGQDPGGTWVLVVKNLNESGESQISNWELEIRALEGTTSYDWMPPTAVTDLEVVQEDGKLWARFTAPADPPTGGPVAALSLRASRSPINSWSFDGATEICQGLLAAQPLTPQSCAIEGLDQGTWYCALRSVDAMGNRSALSNLVMFEVQGGPVELGEQAADLSLDGQQGEEEAQTEEVVVAEEVIELDEGPYAEPEVSDAAGPTEAEVLSSPDAIESDLGRTTKATCGCAAGRYDPGWLLAMVLLCCLLRFQAARRAGPRQNRHDPAHWTLLGQMSNMATGCEV